MKKTFFSLLLLGMALAAPVWADKPVLVFGLLADAQYADCNPNIGRYYRQSLDKLTASVDHLNAQRVRFTVNLGDLIDRKWADIDAPLERLKGLDRPVYHLTGNHDYKDFTDNRVLYDKLRMPGAYYAFRKKGWTFVMLNTNEVASYANVQGTPLEAELREQQAAVKAAREPQGASYNGGVSRAQLAWLDDVLDKAQRRGDRVLVFSHHPLYPVTAFSALNSREVLAVIDRYPCVKALFAGHHHHGHFGYYKQLPAVTVEGMVETEDRNAYGVVKLYKDRIVVEGEGRMTSRELPLEP